MPTPGVDQAEVAKFEAGRAEVGAMAASLERAETITRAANTNSEVGSARAVPGQYQGSTKVVAGQC